MLKKTKSIVLMMGAMLFVFVTAQVFGQDVSKSYFYKRIGIAITINEDTTFNVEEMQTFSFKGNYRNAFRAIPLDKVDAITDIEVIDGLTGEPVEFEAFRKNGEQRIEWHFDITDADYSWILKYKVHGGLSFYKDHDELYWNLLTDYQVPIERVNAAVSLPASVNIDELATQFYASSLSPGNGTHWISPEGRFIYEITEVPSGEDLTIAAGWPKGIVDQGAYWIDFLKIYWGYLFSSFVVFATLLYLFFYWFFTEKYKQGRGTIVPEYDPPQQLRPALAEVIVKESITAKTWSATIIDLAVRGYVTISEEKSWFRKEYRINKAKEYDNDETVRHYEKKFLSSLFADDADYFSTKEVKKNRKDQESLFMNLQFVKTLIIQETEDDTRGYEKPISKDVSGMVYFLALFFGLLAFFRIHNQTLLFLIIFALCLASAFSFARYQPRLNKRGQILREEWLGFKMYLQTAERYRMQNLTPEIFEKYLPYAIIFGVEKKWGKAFDSLNIPPPSWYVGSYAGAMTGSNISSGASGFSAGAFSSSFSSSFTSAFSSSGGGGASGGGGSAGGGGGGGGGGAS